MDFFSLLFLSFFSVTRKLYDYFDAQIFQLKCNSLVMFNRLIYRIKKNENQIEITIIVRLNRFIEGAKCNTIWPSILVSCRKVFSCLILNNNLLMVEFEWKTPKIIIIIYTPIEKNKGGIFSVFFKRFFFVCRF